MRFLVSLLAVFGTAGILVGTLSDDAPVWWRALT